MDNEFMLSRLWADAHLMETSMEQLQEIHSKIVDLFMSIFPSGVISDLTIDVVTKVTVALVDLTLKYQNQDNFMLPSIRDFAERVGTEPRRVVEGAIEVWAQMSMRHSTDNPFHGFGMESKVEIDTEGFALLGYDDDLADQQQLIPDLGQLAMFLVAEIWQPPSVSRLRTAYLMANTTTTMLFGAFTILPYLSKLPWEAILQHNKEHMGLKLFLQTAWKICRPAKSQPPSVKFAASLRGAYLSKDGKRALTDDGPLSDWDPGLRVPGSHWNKFFRNHEQPMFSTSSSTAFPMLYFRMPSSLVAITESYNDYYLELKEKFDESGLPRRTPSDAELDHQYDAFSSATGSSYPRDELETWAAHIEEDIGADILDVMPWIKNATMNANGHLSLPFLNTVARAVRFQEQPEQVQQDIVVFGFKR